MSPRGEGRTGWAARAALGLLAVAAALVGLVYANRIFLDMPLYPDAEGAYLTQALYGKALAARPDLFAQAQVQGSTAFSLVIRALTYGTQHLLEWLRLLGACAYFAGIVLVHRSVRGNLETSQAFGFLLLALAFPYYRFVVAALPDGWFVGLFGLIVLATARLHAARPLVHAALAGTMCGVLALLKPQGLAVAAAFLALAVLDAAAGRRDIRMSAGRVLIFAASFLAAGTLIALAANQPPFSFFPAGSPASAPDGAAFASGARGLALLTSATLVLAGLPILAGLLRIELRWRWGRARKLGPFRLEAGETVFLLVLLSLVAALAMAAVPAAGAPGEADRLRGRDFEFFAPLIWLAAAPFIGEFERAGGRWWRIGLAAVPVVGVAGLAACLLGGAVAAPWDAAALGAFFRLGADGFTLAVPVFALAVAATLAAGLVTAFTTWPVWRIWLGHGVLLAVLSTSVDLAWERSERAQRMALGAEIRAAEAIVARRPGAVAALVQDEGAGHDIFRGLRARPRVLVTAPNEALDAVRLAEFDTLIVAGRRPLAGRWKPVFEGRRLTVFERLPPAGPAPRSESLGPRPGSG